LVVFALKENSKDFPQLIKTSYQKQCNYQSILNSLVNCF